jgi:hypothetical protein
MNVVKHGNSVKHFGLVQLARLPLYARIRTEALLKIQMVSTFLPLASPC